MLLQPRVAGISVLLEAAILLVDEPLVDNGRDLLLLATALRLLGRVRRVGGADDTMLLFEGLEGGLGLAALQVAAEDGEGAAFARHFAGLGPIVAELDVVFGFLHDLRGLQAQLAHVQLLVLWIRSVN